MRPAVPALLVAVLLTLSCGTALGVNVGDKASPVKGEGLNGENVDLSAYIGKKVILLKFGSIYCSTCVSSLEDVARIQRKFKPADLQVVGINLDVYGLPRVRRFYKNFAALLKYPMIIDEKVATARPYDVSSIPAHIVIDKEGVVRYYATGTSPEELRTLEDIVTKLIKGQDIGTIATKEVPLQVFLPINFTKTYQDSIYVVGKAKPGSKLFLTLNGGSRQSVTTMRDLFYMRTPLSLGSNFIEVQVVDDAGGKINQGVVLFREPKIGTGIESPFPQYRFHAEKNEGPCKKCHDLNPPAAGAQGMATATQFCLGCHKEFGTQKMLHGPIPIGGCAPCHDFSSKPSRYAVMAQGQELCFKCHEEKRKDLIKTYLHGPMSAGLCSICHSPHASSEKYQLRRFMGDLCQMCHEGIKAVSLRKNVHKPVADGECCKCHEPHSSERNDNFLKLKANDLCLSCHKLNGMMHMHPFGVPPRTERQIRLDKEGKLLCLSCHEAHASDEVKLQVKGGCNKCHTSP